MRPVPSRAARCRYERSRLLCTNAASSAEQYSDRSVLSGGRCGQRVPARSSCLVSANNTLSAILSILQCTDGKSMLVRLAFPNVLIPSPSVRATRQSSRTYLLYGRKAIKVNSIKSFRWKFLLTFNLDRLQNKIIYYKKRSQIIRERKKI